ncbi:hypothetical protein LINPERHAP2_LOCUS23520, partial [Linum perenne]
FLFIFLYVSLFGRTWGFVPLRHLDSSFGRSVIVFLSLLLGSGLDRMVSEYKSWGMPGFMLFFTLYILLGAQLAKFPRNLEWTLVWISSVYGMKYSNVETEKIL